MRPQIDNATACEILAADIAAAGAARRANLCPGAGDAHRTIVAEAESVAHVAITRGFAPRMAAKVLPVALAALSLEAQALVRSSRAWPGLGAYVGECACKSSLMFCCSPDPEDDDGAA